ncbi:MAG: MFS transporter [Chloroflexia bacterium]
MSPTRFYVYQRTGSTLATAAMVATELLPHLLFGSIAGVFVDRWDRRRIMIVTNFLQMVVVLLLLLVQSDRWFWLVYVVSFLQTTIAAFFGPAEDALLPNLVSEEYLLPANSLNAFNNNLARLAGPPIGGALLAASGLAGIIILDSVSFLIAGVLITLIVMPPKHVTGGVDPVDAARGAWERLWREWLEGLQLIRGERFVATVIGVLVLTSFAGIMFDPLAAPFADTILHAGPQGYAWLMTMQAVGGMLGAVAIARFAGRLPEIGLFGWGSVVAGLLLLVQFNVPSLAVALTIAFLVGFPSVGTRVAANTLLQQNVPDKFRGRVYGALGTSTALLSLVSTLGLAGALGEVVGIVPMLNTAALLTIGAGVLGLVLLPAARKRPHAQPATDAEPTGRLSDRQDAGRGVQPSLTE